MSVALVPIATSWNFSNNINMNAVEHKTSLTDASADAEAVIASALSGRPLDPAVARRVMERSVALRDESARKYGVREIAVELIREIRDEA